MRALLKSLAASLGCRQITDVGSLDRAYEQLEHHTFALGIIDLQLGQSDGVNLIKAFRSSPRAEVRATPLLAASTRSSDERIRVAVAAGADAFLSKPFSILNLQRQILFARVKADERLKKTQDLTRPHASGSTADRFEID